ncbi:hypothetical protein CW751_09125 [Brumimicrobium salinarum]|uniref:Uncharacterized protein n=1 Tax=Brumimicrobium salinarum TaxID=2058658 RepID=A0A2I0R1T3_9FLAO|nr:hypothetical protein [Brumimicrobium salinarum]PKR80526.1 hypothetical protein CW751_09125 [Brumimicrobium salinarum]
MTKISFLGLILCVLLLNSTNAQVISHFTWNDLNQDPEIADVGPNATSISPDATITADGANGTPGLNAGNERTNINMILPNDPIFNVPDIDISIDYQRDENSGTFIKRGRNFSFLGASNLFVRYQVMSTIDSTITAVNSGNVYSIPRTNDNTFRKYRFTFDAATGIGRLTVDGVEMWASAPRPNSILVWDNSTIKIGDKMDGSSENKAIYDNLLIQRYQPEPLPIELISFSADESAFKNQVDLNWSTASEKNNDFFTLEKSTNGKDWELLKTLNGAGNSTHTLKYRWTDQSPYSGISYYRLKQTDFDGKFSYSS